MATDQVKDTDSLFRSGDAAVPSKMAIRVDELTKRTLAREPSQQAIEFEQKWSTWGEMRHVADRITALIDASGAKAGAPIALIPRSRPSAVAALLGLITRRCHVRMIYAFQSPVAIARDIERLQPAVVIAAAEEFTPEVIEVLRSRGIAAIALTDMNAAVLAGFEHSTADVQPSGYEGIEILTSGTTGPPKHFQISYSLVEMLVGSEEDQSKAMPVLLYFPLGNISGVFSTVPTMLKGRRAVLLDRFTVAGWRDYVLRYKPDFGSLPPSGVQMVLNEKVPREDLASLRFIASGAAPLDPTAQRAFEQHYGIPILLSYGATEFGGPVTAMTGEMHAEFGDRKFGSVGRALPGAQLRVVDPDTGALLPPGTEGLLEVVSPRIGPQWIRTSDLAVIDEDGFMFHRGRNDGAIMRGGFKLLPETIERALMLHPAISAAAAIGVKDQRLGEVPGVVMEIKPGIELPTIAQLEAHLRDHIPATHIPVHWRFDTLPRTVSLKVERLGLRKLFENV